MNSVKVKQCTTRIIVIYLGLENQHILPIDHMPILHTSIECRIWATIVTCQHSRPDNHTFSAEKHLLSYVTKISELTLQELLPVVWWVWSRMNSPSSWHVSYFDIFNEISNFFLNFEIEFQIVPLDAPFCRTNFMRK